MSRIRRLPFPNVLHAMILLPNRAGSVSNAMVRALFRFWATRLICQFSEPSFICNSCDSDPKKKIVFGYHDPYAHDLVRVRELVEEVEVTLEDRLADLEQRFIQHEANMDQRLGSLEAKVDDRLMQVDDRLMLVEKLLERVLFALEQPLSR